MITPYGDRREQTEILRARLADAEEMLRAIREGEIDAFVVEGAGGSQVYTLHSAEEPYRNLVEQMQEGAVVLSTHGDILYSNARFAALVGESLQSVVGSHIDRFVDASGKDDFAALLRAGSGRIRCRLTRADARVFGASLSLTTTRSTHGDRVNLVVTDLTELFAANSSRDRAERESRAKDEFLAVLAHELRNPLGVITNAVRVLSLTHAGNEPEPRAHDVIARQVARISQLINDLLDVERGVVGKIRLNRQPLDLAGAVRRTVATFTADAGLNRTIDVSAEAVWVDGDAGRLEQIVTNIVTNAIKYTPPGGRIRVSVRADGPDAVISIDDTGFGISPQLFPSIFDMYVQSERTLDRARGGLGIGLTLVRRLVELHGGTIEASSAGEGYGSCFTVRLKQIPPVGKAPVVSLSPERRAKPRRVLLIEDSGDARAMLRMMLELAGHAVYDAADGVRGLELVNAMRPDVGIIDISLPGMDGYQVARRIREAPHGRGMLLLALTGYDSPGELDRPIDHSAFDLHLVKPVDAEHLSRLLSEGAQSSEICVV